MAMNVEQADPWGQSPAGVVASDPWTSSPAGSANDWLRAAEVAEAKGFDLLDPFDHAYIPLDAWVDSGIDWLVENFRALFQAVRWPIDATLNGIQAALLAVPDTLMLVIIGLLAWQAGGRKLAIGSVLSLILNSHALQLHRAGLPGGPVRRVFRSRHSGGRSPGQGRHGPTRAGQYRR
jgi:glycine betaine/proline transport system permease protein